MATMEKLKLGAAKLGLYLSSGQLELFETYYQELVDWNQRMNLTSVTDYEEVQIKHFLDSVTVVLALPPVAGGSFSVIDVGTGAGLPGIPLKIVLPSIRLALLDATAKKSEFLRHLQLRLGLDNVEIVVGRAEEIAHDIKYREKFEVVLSRGVAPLATLAELTLPFCVIGGIAVTQKKGAIDLEVQQAVKAIDIMGGRRREVMKVELDEFNDERYLVVIEKLSATPERYPRRPGMPAKRPLL